MGDGKITDISKKRFFWWALPAIISLLLWTIGRFMEPNSPESYALQAIFLSALPWGMGTWTIWAMVVAYRWKAKWVWLFWLTPWWFGLPQCKPSTPPQGHDILAVNVNAFTGNQEQLEAYLAELAADIIIVIEKRAEQIRGMTRVADDFEPPLHRASHHMAVFCRESCKAWVSPQIGSSSMAMSFALVQPREGEQLL